MGQRDAADENLQGQHAGADAAETEAPPGLGGAGLLVAAYTQEWAADDTLKDLMRVGVDGGTPLRRCGRGAAQCRRPSPHH
jgi:hypothetical protein